MAISEINASELTKMQTLMASKAVKLISDNNPIMAHKFGADPAVLIYNDTVYVYSTNDMQQLEYNSGKEDNGYNKINSLNIFASKDLVNWTDCGTVAVAGTNGPAKWATNSWAPAIACKKIDGKDKFFLYFADSGNGIGVVTADSPVGPFVDPIQKPLISRSMPNCGNINWLFDPAVMVDDDGKGYLVFGGGHDPEKYEHPKTSRVVALADDMVSIIGTPETLDPPFLFEDSGINKIGNTYVYSYCTNFADRSKSNDKDKMPTGVIGYMTSTSPLGPYEYKGYTLENPGTYYGKGGNNHHWIFQFKNKWYIAYHAQTIERNIGIEKGGYRSLYINDFEINSDGSFPIQKAGKAGVQQVGAFNPYEEIPAATFHSIINAGVTNNQTVKSLKDGAYVCIKGVDFSAGAKKVEINTAKSDKSGTVKFQLDGFGGNGTLISEVKTKKSTAEEKVKLPENLNGKHDLYIILSEGVELINWQVK